MLLAIAPAPAALRRALGLRRRRSRTPSPLRALRQAVSSSSRLTARDLRRLYLEAIRERVPDASSSSRRDPFARALRRAGVTEETAQAASDLLSRLDEAAFSPAGAIDSSAVERAAALARAVDAEAVRPVHMSGPTRALVIMFCIAGVSGVLDALPEGAANTFRQGVEAYDHGAFTTSQSLFARVAARAPRAVDAWANLGTAAWSRGDSAAAVRGWQRALRLDPLDGDARDRLESVQSPSMRSPGYVPPLPVNALALAALACWLGAWLLLIVPPARRPTHARALAGGALMIAVLLLAGAMEVRGRLDPRGLAVLRTSRLLLDAPGSEVARASGTIGETGVLGAREGAWVRIALDGARAGWVPVASILPLDAPPLGD
jgi:tetratricopeptide (TPR) repeat protein